MKKYSVLIIILILLMLGGGAYFLNSKNRVKPTDENNESKTTATPEVSDRKSLKDLLTLGTSQKCTYHDDTSPANIEGTSYVSGGKIRSDYTSTVDDKKTEGHMIYDGKKSYIWMEGQNTGMMMEIDLSKSENSVQSNSSAESSDFNKTFDYKCSVWLPDIGLFNPPTDIKFQSFVIPTMTQGDSATGSKNLCDTCNSLSGDQKTQCLKAFSCN